MAHPRLFIVISLLSFLTLATAFMEQNDDQFFIKSNETPNPSDRGYIPTGRYAVSNLLGENIRIVSYGIPPVNLPSRKAEPIGLPLGITQQNITLLIGNRNFIVPVRQCFRYTIYRENGVLRCKETL